MKYEIRYNLMARWYWVVLHIAGHEYEGTFSYTTRRAAVRGAKRAGGTEEVK